MNIGKRLINEVKYAYYGMILDVALYQMKKHEIDENSKTWTKWAELGLKCLAKKRELNIKFGS